MSRPAAASSSSASVTARRPLSPSARTGDDADRPAQRARIDRDRDDSDADTVSPPPARPLALPSHSQAQRSAVDQTDAWLCMLAYLPLKYLPRIVRTCRAWQYGAMKERCRQVEFDTKRRLARVDSALHSPLLRLHVRSLHLPLTDQACMPGSSLLNDAAVWMMRLHEEMPQLTQLDVVFSPDALTGLLRHCQLEPRRVQFLQSAFPPSLTALSLLFYAYSSASCASLQLLVDALSSSPGLQVLGVWNADMEDRDEVRWDSLLRLRLLQTFRQDDYLTPAQYAALKRMDSLTQLSARITGAPMLTDLCSQPHQLQQLTKLDLERCDVGLAEMKHIATLPALICLHPKSLNPSAFPLLSGLTRLRSLHLSDCEPTSANVPVLIASLRALSQLTELKIHVWNGGDTPMPTYLAEVLRATPHLQELFISTGTARDEVSLASLHFLAAVPQLTRLCFDRSTRLADPAQLLSLGITLPRLRKFTLDHVPPTVLDALSPPSSAVPSLRYLNVASRIVQMPDDDDSSA